MSATGPAHSAAPYTPTQSPLLHKLQPNTASSAPPVHYNGDSSYWVQRSTTPNSALSAFIPFQPPLINRPLASASSSRAASSSKPRPGSGHAPAAGFHPAPPPAVASAAVRRPLFPSAPPAQPPTASAGQHPAAGALPRPTTLPALSSALLVPTVSHAAATTPERPHTHQPTPTTALSTSSLAAPSRVPGLSAARANHVSSVAAATQADFAHQVASSPILSSAAHASSAPPSLSVRAQSQLSWSAVSLEHASVVKAGIASSASC